MKKTQKAEYNPKRYFDNGDIIEYGRNLLPEERSDLKSGKILTVFLSNGRPHRRIFMDQFDQIRCSYFPNPKEWIAKIMFGLIESPFYEEPIY